MKRGDKAGAWKRVGTSHGRRVRLALLLAGTSAGALAIAGAGPANVARAADVDITTSTNNGIVLDGFAGTTAQIEAGVTVSNTTFNFNCAGSLAALCATTKAWTATNLGTIGPADFGTGVSFTAGGAIINSGSISGGKAITIEGGASVLVDNKLGATISSPGCCGGIVIGESSGVAGTVTNAGTITSASQAVSLWGGGTVTNLATGVIQAHDQANAVSVILGTSRIVNNYGIIQSNDAGFGTGVAIQNGVLTNYLGGQILGAYNGVWANGSSATSITNNGYIEASLAQGGGSAIEVDGGGTVTNTGTIKSFTSNGNTTDAGINFIGAGSITNSGTIASTTGGWSILFNGNAAHTLNLNTGSVLIGNVQGGSGTDNLVLMGIGTESIAKFLFFETLSMQGTEWNLTGTGTFTTSGEIQSGILHVNGTLTTPTLTVNTGGTLGGSGTIVGAVTVNGTIAPGNSIGTLNITGPYTQATGSTYQPEINPAGQSDLINVTGAANIQSGAAVSVVAAPGTYTLGQRYTILTASAGVTGQYTTLTDNAPFVDFQLDADANNIYLDVLRNAIPFQEIAQTRNQRAAAGAIEALGPGNTVFDAVTVLDTPNALRAFDLVSGEIHASIIGTLDEDSRFIRDAVTGRLRQSVGGPASVFAPQFATLDFTGDAGGHTLAFDSARTAQADAKRSGARDAIDRVTPAKTDATADVVTAWGWAFGNWGSTASDGNAASVRRATGGFISGIDTTRTANGGLWRWGLAGGYQNTSVNVGDRASSGSIDTYHLAAYAGGQFGAVGLRTGVAYGWHDIGANRTIAFPGLSDATQARYSAHTAQVFGEIGYGFTYRDTAFEPFAALAYVDVRTDSFTEFGQAAALTGLGGGANTTFSTLGLRAATPLSCLGLPDITAKQTLGWRYAFGSLAPTARLAFASGGADAFAVAGVPIAQEAATTEMRLEGSIARNTTASIAYMGQIAQHAHDHGLNANVVVRF